AYCRPATPPPHPERGRVVAVPSPRRLPGACGRAEGRPGFGCAAGPGSRAARDLRLDAKEPLGVAEGFPSLCFVRQAPVYQPSSLRTGVRKWRAMIPATTTIADSTDSATPVKSSPTRLPTARITAVTRTGSFRMRSRMARMMVSFLARRISPEIDDFFDRQPLQEGAGVVDEMVGDVLVPDHRVPLFDLPLPHLVDALLVGSWRCRITPKAHWEGSRTVVVPHCRHSIHDTNSTPKRTDATANSNNRRTPTRSCIESAPTEGVTVLVGEPQHLDRQQPRQGAV